MNQTKFNYIKRRPFNQIFTFPLIKPRKYQLKAWSDYHNGVKNIILSMPRRSGKDLCSVSMAVDYAMNNPDSAVVLMAPDRSWAKRIYMESGQKIVVRDPITNYQRTLSGTLLDMCLPEKFRSKTNVTESKIYLKNGSTITLMGSSEMTFVGMRISFLVISEAARHNPNIIPLLTPVMRESGGITIYNGTVEDEINYFWKKIQDVKNLPNWSVTYLTAEHTKEYFWVSEPDEEGKREFNINPELQGRLHPETKRPYSNIEDNRKTGEKLSFLVREYLNVPTSVEDGSYYAPLINSAIVEGRIGVQWTYNPDHPVYLTMDLGISDDSAIVWFQYIDNEIYFIDYYEKNNVDIEHFIDVIRSKPYKLRAAYAPHDAVNRNLQTGMNLIDFCRTKYNFQFSYISKTNSIISDIQVVRGYFNKMHFDKIQCEFFIAQLNRYHQKATTNKPDHGQESHAADAFRYAIMAIHKDLLSAAEFMNTDMTVPQDTSAMIGNVSDMVDYTTSQSDEKLLRMTMSDYEDTWK